MGPLHPDLGEVPRMTTVACFYATMTLANCTLISRRPSANLLSEASHDASVQLPLEFTPYDRPHHAGMAPYPAHLITAGTAP